MNTKPVFLFIFANDALHKLRLDKEWDAVEDALQTHNDEGRINFNLTPSAKFDTFWRKSNRFYNKITVFHYGGHSSSKGLDLPDGLLSPKQLTALLSQETNLKLVFLNACTNVAFVKALFQKHVPLVIATTAPISDNRASQFAKQFYAGLASGRTIKGAFEVAAAYVNREEKEVLIDYRGLALLNKDDDELEWGLYAKDETALEWRIPTSTPSPIPVKSNLWKYLLTFLLLAGLSTGIYFFLQIRNSQTKLDDETEIIDNEPIVEEEKEKSIEKPIDEIKEPNDTKTQNPDNGGKPPVITNTAPKSTPKPEGKPKTFEYSISGQVVDNDGKPIKEATLFRGSKEVGKTDANGHYRIEISNSQRLHSVKLKVKKEGYKDHSKSWNINNNPNLEGKNLKLEKDE